MFGRSENNGFSWGLTIRQRWKSLPRLFSVFVDISFPYFVETLNNIRIYLCARSRVTSTTIYATWKVSSIGPCTMYSGARNFHFEFAYPHARVYPIRDIQ